MLDASRFRRPLSISCRGPVEINSPLHELLKRIARQIALKLLDRNMEQLPPTRQSQPADR